MEDDRLTQEQINAVKDALVNFVTRVSAESIKFSVYRHNFSQ